MYHFIILQCGIPTAGRNHRGKANWICCLSAPQHSHCGSVSLVMTRQAALWRVSSREEKPGARKYHTTGEFVTLTSHRSHHNCTSLIYITACLRAELNHIVEFCQSAAT